MVSKLEAAVWPFKTSFGVANYIGSMAWRLGVGGVRLGIDNNLVRATRLHLDRVQKDQARQRIEPEKARNLIARGVGELTAAHALERDDGALEREEVAVLPLLLPAFGISAASTDLQSRGVDKHQADMLEKLADAVLPDGQHPA